MATNWTYSPIIGDFSADAILLHQQNAVSGVFIPPDSSNVAFAGKPRPGTLKWYFLLNNPDTSIHADDAGLIFFVKTPFAVSMYPAPVPANGFKGLNSFMPIVSLGVTGEPVQLARVYADVVTTAAVLEGLVPYLAGKLDPSYLYATCGLNITPAPALSEQVTVLIDFSHSSIN